MQIPPAGSNPYPTLNAAASPADAPPKAASDPVQDFLSFAHKTPAEQMRDQILHALGVTEDSLKSMDPTSRAKIEAKVKELVREKVQESVEKKTGLAVDIKA